MPLINTNKMDNQKTKQLEERLEQQNGYSGIDPQSGWNRKNFVGHFNHLEQIFGYHKQIEETKGEIPGGLKGDLSEVLNGNDFLAGQSDEIVRSAAKNGKKEGEKRMAEWARNNIDSLYKEIDSSEHADQMYMQLVRSVPLCMTGDKEHDETFGYISKVREADDAMKAAQNEDISKMRKIVEDKAKTRKLPEWKQKLIKEFIGDNRLVHALFMEEYQLRKNLMNHNLSTQDGKADREKIKSLIAGSLSKKWQFYEKETHEDTKKKIYEKHKKDEQTSTPEIARYYERKKEREEHGIEVPAEDIVKILDERKAKAGGH